MNKLVKKKVVSAIYNIKKNNTWISILTGVLYLWINGIQKKITANLSKLKIKERV